MSPYIIQDVFVEKSYRLIVLETSIIKNGIHRINNINLNYSSRRISASIQRKDIPLLYAYFKEVVNRCGISNDAIININSKYTNLNNLLNLYKFDTSQKDFEITYNIELRIPCN